MSDQTNGGIPPSFVSILVAGAAQTAKDHAHTAVDSLRSTIVEVTETIDTVVDNISPDDISRGVEKVTAAVGPAAGKLFKKALDTEAGAKLGTKLLGNLIGGGGPAAPRPEASSNGRHQAPEADPAPEEQPDILGMVMGGAFEAHRFFTQRRHRDD
jgi:hypothetical protein